MCRSLLAVTVALGSACVDRPVADGEFEDEVPDAEPAPSRLRVLYIGDSIARETSSLVRGLLVETGKVTYAESVADGIAICDVFPEAVAAERAAERPDLAELVTATQPDLVVMQFWGTQRSPCMSDLDPRTRAYHARYAEDAERAMTIIADASGPHMPQVLWVLQGPDREHPMRPQVLNESYRDVAARWPTARPVDAGREVSLAATDRDGDRYGWSDVLPCTEYERFTGHCAADVAQIHKPGDDVHFCLAEVSPSGACDVWSPGVMRFGFAIVASVTDALEL
ncbi:MAG: hypothetical protein H0T79_14230 [Deltaproteobacteria bacterium]|nr:hypothetical protein [Deltaproteobacteria bacterium]